MLYHLIQLSFEPPKYCTVRVGL